MEYPDRIIPIAIEDEVKESYLNYAMSVIVSRALPDARDGLKPVHRRILYAMNEMGLRHDKAYKKCGRIVGDVLGKYHPHGDQSIYDALVRLAQEFSLRIPVVQGQGNFGSIDGDPPAAMRYTEARMARIAELMLKDINKETVDFGPNSDDSMEEPLVLPTMFPFLLINGASGIAVGMATNIAPHNLNEICNGIAALIDNKDIDIDDLLEHVSGPDFPTSGIIYGRRGIKMAAKTGRGKITIRAKYHIEEKKNGKQALIYTELPYQVNKAELIIKIAELVKDKKIEGISDLRDESDRNGIRMVVEIKKGFPAVVIINNLFSHTRLQTNFNVNCLAIHKGVPKIFNLKELMETFIAHRKEIITRRTIFDLNKAKARAHILEGIQIAIQNIDEVIEIIKKSPNVAVARAGLIERFKFSEKQAQAILDLRLQKLTSLETQKIIDELQEILKFIAYCEDLLANEYKIYNIIKEETLEMGEKFGEERRTEILDEELEAFDMEDVIKKENVAILLSTRGLIKRIPASSYREQGRGGKGASTSKLKEDDVIKHFFIALTHHYVLFITNKGKAYWLKAYQIPEGSKASRGRHVSALFPFEEGEEITETVIVEEFSQDKYLLMATNQGTVKKVCLHDFRNAKARGIRAINLDENDFLISALKTDGDKDVFLISQNGKALRVPENQIRCMGRISRGCRGIKLLGDDRLVGVCIAEENKPLLLISENGYGKRMLHSEFSPHSRGTQGQRVYNVTEKTGKLIGAVNTKDNFKIISITELGKAIKTDVNEISTMGRNAFGVRIVNISEDDKVIGLAVEDPDQENMEELETQDSADSNETSADAVEANADKLETNNEANTSDTIEGEAETVEEEDSNEE